MAEPKEPNTVEGGFVIGGDPVADLKALQDLLKLGAQQRVEALRERTERAQAEAHEFAAREVSALIAGR